MNETAKKIINVLFISGEEKSLEFISSVLGLESEEIEKEMVEINKTLENVGLSLFKNNNLYSMTTSSTYSSILKSIREIEVEKDLTPAALQTITIVAYLKSATPAEVSFVRGVQSTQTLRSLSTRGLVKIGTGEQSGKYTLTTDALHYLSIENENQLVDFEKINTSLKQKLQEALNG